MKVIDKIGGAANDPNKVVFSFEFFPPKTEDGVDNLLERMKQMVAHNPSFCDITQRAGGTDADLTLEIANKMQNIICVETMIHLTCINMSLDKIDHVFLTIKNNGIHNVLALRGDPPHVQENFVQTQGRFACVRDLVEHIRTKYDDYFGITVVGYPEAHSDVIGSDGLVSPEDYQNDLAYLKSKLDVGADLIITQLFYDTDIFLKFVSDCRQIGITCPIVPGIMPINDYKGFIHMTGLCKTKIPTEIMAALEPIKDNEEAANAYGIHLGTEMCKKIMTHGINTIHLYTLNREKSALAILMVEHIRTKYGDYFGITVAGYPEAHPNVIGSDGLVSPEGYQNDLAYLKSKVDAGADLIVTQLFYDIDIFLKFVSDCRQIGITCPIVPGIMPINNYKRFIHITGLCKTKIPTEIMAALETIKDNDEVVEAYGIDLGTEMCKKIMAHGINIFHLYTLNMEKSALAILMNLGLIEESKISRSLPWRRPANVFRVKEDVRPIFWANRPKSYISRTIGWDQYPHGRWSDSGNPSYGALTDYQFMRPRAKDKKLIKEWAVPLRNVEDIYERFRLFCLGKLRTNPWSEFDGLQPETKIINDHLEKTNLKGFLTINSQLTVNGEKSDSPIVGWGGSGGYVYQKAYLEFFCSKEKLDALIEKIKDQPFLTYMAVNKEGIWKSNVGQTNTVNAVTWGVFPAKEIIQPTIVDPVSFNVWKNEAFEIWSRVWANLYPEADASKKLVEEVGSNYFLVSLVDNDYINGDLFGVFADF